MIAGPIGHDNIKLMDTGSVTGQYNLLNDPVSAGTFVNGSDNNIVGKDDGAGGRTHQSTNEIVDGSLIYVGGFAPLYGLAAESPAIDKGFSSEAHDQRGNPFVRSAGAAPDIGAFEVQAASENTYVVNTTDDIVNFVDGVNTDGLLSLREALMLAGATPGRDVIDLSGLPHGARIVLNGADLWVNDDVQIIGQGGNQVTIDGDGKSGVFRILSVDAELVGVTITGGYGYVGGGIYNFGNLTVTNSSVIGNEATYVGGGIYNAGSSASLTVIGSTIAGNRSSDQGGGVYNSGNTTIVNSTVSSNHASKEGGGVHNDYSGKLSVFASTITNNSSLTNGGGIAAAKSTSETRISGSIVAGNIAPANAELFESDSAIITSLGNNVLHSGPSDTVAVWDTGTGANRHAYQVVSVPSGITWDEANAAAIAVGGHLATITSAEENDFVFGLIDDPSYWAFDGSYNLGPWLGGYQPSGSTEPAEGWKWIDSDEALSYINWDGSSGEPNNGSGAEDRIHYLSRTANPDRKWNDIWGGNTRVIAYVIEYDQAIYQSTDIIGVDPMLDILADNGGPTLTHGLLAGSPAIDAAPQLPIADSVRDWSTDGEQVISAGLAAITTKPPVRMARIPPTTSNRF
ncbi:MAG: choice-of-anchor Q domain-containing protein [Pirellulaceae bacterium]